jgi:hypothetical protein
MLGTVQTRYTLANTSGNFTIISGASNIIPRAIFIDKGTSVVDIYMAASGQSPNATNTLMSIENSTGAMTYFVEDIETTAISMRVTGIGASGSANVRTVLFYQTP